MRSDSRLTHMVFDPERVVVSSGVSLHCNDAFTVSGSMPFEAGTLVFTCSPGKGLWEFFGRFQLALKGYRVKCELFYDTAREFGEHVCGVLWFSVLSGCFSVDQFYGLVLGLPVDLSGTWLWVEPGPGEELSEARRYCWDCFDHLVGSDDDAGGGDHDRSSRTVSMDITVDF